MKICLKLVKVSLEVKCLSEEVVLTNRTVALVRLAEPLSDAGNVELVLAGLARHLRERLIVLMDDCIANVAILHSINLTLNVSFPC